MSFDAHNSDVGSFEQQNGHQTYNLTDDLRADRIAPSDGASPPPPFTDDLGDVSVWREVEDRIASVQRSLWITTDDLGTFR